MMKKSINCIAKALLYYKLNAASGLSMVKIYIVQHYLFIKYYYIIIKISMKPANQEIETAL